MQTYKDYRPTPHDTPGLNLDNRQGWLVHPCGTNRDADEIHRFGHWACGWLEIILVRPGSKAEAEAQECEACLANYPILDDMHCSEVEQTEANEVWSNCYSTLQRLAYIKSHRSQFEFHSFADMLSCVRGNYFAGYASELIQ